MKKVFITAAFFLCFLCNKGFTQYPPAFSKEIIAGASVDPMKRVLLSPQRIVWKSNDSLVQRSEVLLQKGTGQAFFGSQPVCRLTNKGNDTASIILDFGKEIMGGLQITTSQSNRVTRKIRIRFGESVSETFSTVTGDGTSGKDGGATNHHAMRDFELTLPGYGTTEVGNSGFRFVRIDLLDKDAFVVLKEVRAIAVFRDIPYLGSFKCNDDRLNKIWETGAYTVHLNMQEYLYDGIKRDRMVWAGDMHPELMVINTVFGYQEVLPKSLDFLRDNTALPKFMNGIPSYSLWWIIMQHDWYQYHGKLSYLQEQKSYLLPLLELFAKYVDEKGSEQLQNIGFRFLNWPSSRNKEAVHAGLQGMMVIAFEKGAALCKVLGEETKAKEYLGIAAKMRKYAPDPAGSKEAASLLTLAGITDAVKTNKDVIAVGGAENFSAFFGYYMLQAQAKAGDYKGALNNIRSFWGGMLDMGATTFWEEFDLKEAEGSAPIDDVVPSGKKDYHWSTGDYCYIGVRRSLCHGWSAGPTAWLSEHVLGIQVLEPGCKKIKISPQLGDLHFAEGTFPTPMGVLYVKHTKAADGKVSSVIKAPRGVVIVK
ncbi:MAG: alpha-L-rhamnosidase [Chitinophagaceae bacterium]|nr:alpha-L-rhamnosidase [Chitinophagaceae bacterium]